MRVATMVQKPCVRPHTTRRCVRSRANPFEVDLLLALAHKEVDKSCVETFDEAACYVAWDNVDEIYRGLAHRKEKQETDPLEIYCDAVPEGDECREYDV